MIVYLNSKPRRQCNVISVLHYALDYPHPDSKRQRGRRQIAKDRKLARALKQCRITWLPEMPVVFAERRRRLYEA